MIRKKFVLFEIANSNDKQITLNGLWHDSGRVEYIMWNNHKMRRNDDYVGSPEFRTNDVDEAHSVFYDACDYYLKETA